MGNSLEQSSSDTPTHPMGDHDRLRQQAVHDRTGLPLETAAIGRPQVPGKERIVAGSRWEIIFRLFTLHASG
jgi:hypothetical protein